MFSDEDKQVISWVTLAWLICVAIFGSFILLDVQNHKELYTLITKTPTTPDYTLVLSSIEKNEMTDEKTQELAFYKNFYDKQYFFHGMYWLLIVYLAFMNFYPNRETISKNFMTLWDKFSVQKLKDTDNKSGNDDGDSENV